jgi:hypothetical protein
MSTFRKWIILSHRYLGIVLSLFFVIWFVSGIGMIYSRGMPTLTPELWLERLPELNMSAVKLSASEAEAKAQLGRPPFSAVLLTVMDRPAYQFSSDGTVTVFADTGDLLPPIGQKEAMTIAGNFMGLATSQLHYGGELLQPDQWTLEQRGQLPMHKIQVDDPFRTELYISGENGEVELMTTRGSRALAWLAAIPHWMYFAPLRIKDNLWRQFVLWISGAGAVLALLGVTLAFIQFPARYSGLMRWHYLTGAFFGIFALTWVFSGWLSMEPFFWASGGGTGYRIPLALSGGPLDLSAFPNEDAGAWEGVLTSGSPKQIEFLRIQNQPYFFVRSTGAEPELVSAHPFEIRNQPFSVESLMARVKQGNPDVEVEESRLLTDYDSYYHPGDRRPALPVLRVKFADADATWFYIDPRIGQVVARFTRRERLQRWIYHGLHSLDFNFWYYNGRVWRAAMVGLNAGGAILSMIGLVLAIRRVKRRI